MRLQFFGAASIAIHTKENTKILCDPWFETPAFLGSWIPFPKVEFDYKQKYDFIYISHIHSDHFDVETLRKINLDTSILIYKFENDFLVNKIRGLGFTKIIQLRHGEEFFVDKNTRVKIYGPVENDSDAKQQVIDTSIVVYDNEHTILNFNDNLYELRDKTLQLIKKEHPCIDLLCHGYTSASSYPQCTISLNNNEMASERKKVKEICYQRSIKLIEFLNPKNTMPFAGYYVLCGKKSHLNNLKANDSPLEASKFYEQNYPHVFKNRQCIVLNVEESYDLNTNTYSKIYEPPTENELSAFIEKNKNVKYPYERMVEALPPLGVFSELIQKSYDRMEIHRKKMKFHSDTKLFINLPENKKLLLTMNGKGFTILKDDDFTYDNVDNFVLMSLDFRLLYMLLRGPRYAHWDNADHGSHIEYYKKPNIYEKGIYHLICYFHS